MMLSLTQKLQHAPDDAAAVVGALDRAELGGADGDHASHAAFPDTGQRQSVGRWTLSWNERFLLADLAFMRLARCLVDQGSDVLFNSNNARSSASASSDQLPLRKMAQLYFERSRTTMITAFGAMELCQL